MHTTDKRYWYELVAKTGNALSPTRRQSVVLAAICTAVLCDAACSDLDGKKQEPTVASDLYGAKGIGQ